jgi:metal-responsive CopG/Arc/MetJ family transcriptional regulator
MKRITISLPDDMARALEREARRQGASVSAVVREALIDPLHMPVGETRDLPFAGVGRSGKRDTARRAEEILAEEWDADRDR